MNGDDKKFYGVWGGVLILAGIASAFSLYGLWGDAALIFFGGVGVALIAVMGRDNMKLFGGISFIILGIVMYSALNGVSIVYGVVASVIVAGGLVVWYGIRGGRNE